MRLFYLILAILVFLLMQAVVAERIALGPVSPDFLALVVAIFALYRGPVRGSIFGFVIGFLQDLLNPGYLGLYALSKSVLGFAVGKAGTKTFPENILFLFILFMAAVFGHDVVYLLFYHWPRIGTALAAIFTVALPSAAYTALFGVLVHKLLAMAGPKVVRTIGKEG
jgi:rod shape-determining protein MreD